MEDSKKIKYFDELIDLYYKKNFASITKTEIDLKMFGFYYEENKEKTDFEIAKELGITPTKVSNLVFKYLLSKDDVNDDKEIWGCFNKKSIHYDRTNEQITILIPNRYVYSEIENTLEKLGGIVNKQINPKLLTISKTDFFNLLSDKFTKEDIEHLLEMDFSIRKIVDYLYDKKEKGENIKKLMSIDTATSVFLGMIFDALKKEKNEK